MISQLAQRRIPDADAENAAAGRIGAAPVWLRPLEIA